MPTSTVWLVLESLQELSQEVHFLGGPTCLIPCSQMGDGSNHLIRFDDFALDLRALLSSKGTNTNSLRRFTS